MTQTKSRPDWITMLLLALMFTMPAWTLAQAEWAPGLELLQPTAIAALLIGVLVARSRFRPLAAHILMMGYGAAWIALASMPHLPRVASLKTLGAQLTAWGRHIAEWLWLLFQTGVGKDNFIFLLALMIVFWLIAVLAVWNTFRVTRVMRAVLPAGLIILVNLYYYGGRAQLSIFMYAYFVFTLMYLVRINLIAREQEWQRSRVGFDRDDVRGSFVRGGTIVTTVAVVAAWIMPQVASMPQVDDLWQQLSRPIRSLEDAFNRIFSTLEGNGPAMVNPFGRTLGFAGPRSLGDTVLLDARVFKNDDNSHNLVRYWRAGTYDQYTTNGWISSEGSTYLFSPNAEPLDTPYQQRANVRQSFSFYFPRTSLLLASSQPVYFNRDAEAQVQLATLAGAGASAGRLYIDPTFVYSRDALRAGDVYEVVSSVSVADVDRLRAAGTPYPAWITERYLQLPANFPQRVKDLARQIVSDAGATNSFDQASALEAWLRTHIDYNDKIEGPQLGQDGVDYVLFESHAGYCDYYAAAMVTMARSLGIPARVAVGYARGEYDAKSDTYRVRERDAHAWVEAYFAGYGWVEFEPTASQPQIARPVSADDLARAAPTPAATPAGDASDIERRNRFDELEQDAFAGGANAGLGNTLPAWLLAAFGALALGVVVVFGAVYVVENRGLRHLQGAQWAYARLVRLARWLRVDLGAHQTPYEQATLLRDAAPETREAIDSIAGDFVRETFARDPSGAPRARLLWRKTHRRLWLAGLRRRVLGAIARYRRPDFLKLRFPGRK